MINKNDRNIKDMMRSTEGFFKDFNLLLDVVQIFSQLDLAIFNVLDFLFEELP